MSRSTLSRGLLAALLCAGLVVLALPGGAVHAEDEVPGPRPLDPKPEENAEPEMEMKVGEVKLESAGEGERVLLRYKPTVGARHLSTTRMTVTTTVPQMGEMKMPTTVIKQELAVTKREANGNYTCRMVMKDTAMEGDDPMGMGAMMGAGLEAMEGLAMVATLSGRGKMLKLDIEGGEDLPTGTENTLDMIRNSSENMAPSLPEEPVGVGAKWSQSVDVKANGMSIDQVIRYTVSKIDGDQVHLDVEFKQTAKPQTFNNPMGQMELKSLSGGGKGTMVLDLAVGFATSMSNKIESKMGMVAPGMGQEMEVGSKVEISVTLKPLAAVTPTTEGEKKPAPVTPEGDDR